MTKAQDRLIKHIQIRNFEKYISVAHKDNGKDFILEVPCRVFYFFTFIFFLSSLNFTFCFLHDTSLRYRLTVIFLPFLWRTCLSRNFKRLHVDASVKARWLWWWNSPADFKTINKFPIFFHCARRLSMIGFTRLRFGHMYSNSSFFCFVFYPFSLSILILCFSPFSWRRGMRLRSPP